MQKRHDDMLTLRLEQALDEGYAIILRSELYRWYSVQKIAAGTRRDLNQRWIDLTDGEHGQLHCVETNNGMVIFGETTVNPVYTEKGD